MTTFYICRHGETENNKKRLLSGWIDTPLTELGINNAAASASKLRDIKIDKIISSDLGRAFTTAQLIAKDVGYTGEIETFTELREVNYGKLANTAIADYPKISAQDNADYIPLEGESLRQMARRVTDFIKDYADHNPGQTILVVAHDGTMKAIYSDFSKQDIGLVDAELTNAHDSVTKFVCDNGSINELQKLG